MAVRLGQLFHSSSETFVWTYPVALVCEASATIGIVDARDRQTYSQTPTPVPDWLIAIQSA